MRAFRGKLSSSDQRRKKKKKKKEKGGPSLQQESWNLGS
jgi:hypothetical protein